MHVQSGLTPKTLSGPRLPNKTALMYASEKGVVDMVQMLLDAGADAGIISFVSKPMCIGS